MYRRSLLFVVAIMCVSMAPAGRASVPRPPLQEGSPWPQMRHDARNTGRSDLRATYRQGAVPWSFETGKGIFSTPVIGADGAVYFGSADENFYALNPNGTERWRYATGGIIDSAATIGRDDPSLGSSPITFGSGDGNLYRLRADSAPLDSADRLVWKFANTLPPVSGELVNWFEGNVVTGHDGTLYAGTTNGYGFAVNPDGTQKWAWAAGNAVWSAAAVAPDGTTYWDSLDLQIYAVDSNGKTKWRTPTSGFLSASIAVGTDGTLYVGSWDSRVYALDSATGVPKWSFPTSDHIYASAALGEDAFGNTDAIYVASTDGSIYALSPGGDLLWRYDTGDAVRSSPVVGRAPEGEQGDIVYAGSSNGNLYAINSSDGTRRWSFDTTPDDPVLRDRNDLNASAALGSDGVYIGGEHGRMWRVPYDYCLNVADARCETDPGEEFAGDLTGAFLVSSGGSTMESGPESGLPAAVMINARLVVRRNGETVDAAMLPGPSGTAKDLVSVSPAFDFDAQLSGDGHFLHIVPRDILDPDTNYRVHLKGNYTSDGIPASNTVIGGTSLGVFDDDFVFRTGAVGGIGFPMSVGPNEVSAVRLDRIAVPLPPMLPSINQIGFDSFEWLAGAIDVSPPDANGGGSVVLWVVSGKRDPATGIWVADPAGDFAFPLTGRYSDDAFALSLKDLTLDFGSLSVPVTKMEMRGRLSPHLDTLPGASLYGEVECLQVPVYGPLAFLLGLCNTNDKLAAAGTFITRAYDAAGPANKRPAGLSVIGVSVERPTALSDGSVVADLALEPGAHYSADRHVMSIMLSDAVTGEVVAVDYRGGMTTETGATGDVAQVRLTIPRGTGLPDSLRVHVIADVFPLATMDR
ncbi:MAG: PQQ-binding-like beta-propeller repeat protein [Actinomycetota bacterium]